MAESEEEREKRNLRELEGKNVAFYSTLLSAWIQTRMERDKTLITLSSAAIALLVTILTAIGINQIYTLFFCVVAFLCFGLCVGTSLHIYQLNSIHLENELGSENKDIKLEKYDKVPSIFFLFGVFFLCSFGVSSANLSFLKTENLKVNNQNNIQINTVEKEDKSLGGIGRLKPKEPANKPQENETPANDKN